MAKREQQHYTAIVRSLTYWVKQLADPAPEYERLRERNAWSVQNLTLEEWTQDVRRQAATMAKTAEDWLRRDAANRLREEILRLGPDLAYTTTRRLGGPASDPRICVYQNDPDNPTGVLLAASFRDCEETRAVVREHGTALHSGPQRGQYAGERPEG